MSGIYPNTAVQTICSEKTLKTIILRAKALGLDRNPKFIKLFSILKINPSDSEILALVVEILEEAEMAKLADPSHPTNPNKFDVIDGQVVIGQTSSGPVFGLNTEEFFRHVLIVGSSGSGKSALMKLIASQILAKDSR